MKRQSVELFNFLKSMNTTKAETLKPIYLVFENIAKVTAHHIYGEKVAKRLMICCAVEVVTLSTIRLSNDTISTRLNKMSNSVE